jgi:antitoxin component HigA of HigAB toxin-antitoxin module
MKPKAIVNLMDDLLNIKSEKNMSRIFTKMNILLDQMPAKRHQVVTLLKEGKSQNPNYELALEYAKTRKAFGKTISDHQAIQFKLADMATEIEAARLLCLKAAWLKDKHEDYTKAEEFVSQLENKELNEEEEKLLLILSELMGYYDEKYIIPKYKLTPQELIQYLLEEKGFSQIQLADYLGVQQPNINAILKGTRDLSKDLMKKIHEKFKIPYDSMF